ncbi:MAG: type II toxin-antitoxin system RelE/ParE family toxin [Bdellovibrionales bacterium]|nr:type II toxin-antitoxin system RelE/ParE family toxin [Bdellovibrionales bacterium]
MSHQRVAVYYRDRTTGKEPAREWLESLKDRVGRSRIFARIHRAEMGNFGDHKSVGGGVMELRIAIGPGYRVYYSLEGSDIILLLIGGDKSTQLKDIEMAKRHWLAHKAEK